jgi:dTDP-4-dehydrorhamnose 3,5-epimerase
MVCGLRTRPRGRFGRKLNPRQVPLVEGCVVTSFPSFVDSRGEWRRVAEVSRFPLLPDGDEQSIRQVSISVNKKRGTVRGLHYLESNQSEYKNVTCFSGRIFDVVVDLRGGSPTYGKFMTLELTSEGQSTSIIIPPGCAHGFQTLEDESVIAYSMTADYSSEHDNGINPLDSVLGIDWPLTISEISSRDSGLPSFSEEF